jgi:hypothetical protein
MLTMDSSNLVRLAGLATLLGSVLLAIGAISRRLAIGSPTIDHPFSEAVTT